MGRYELLAGVLAPDAPTETDPVTGLIVSDAWHALRFSSARFSLNSRQIGERLSHPLDESSRCDLDRSGYNLPLSIANITAPTASNLVGLPETPYSANG